ncbi:hypothetical protein TNCV_4441851 [Trichonephila clavipes]|nr:hypothetical protein TNCV_4441851 [Trichonephila clavipes]
MNPQYHFCNSSRPNLKLKIKGFTTLRKDRKDRPGGGLAFLVKSAGIKFREITLPPTTDYDENSTEVQAINLLNTLLDTKLDTKILLGDLNAKSPSLGVQDPRPGLKTCSVTTISPY